MFPFFIGVNEKFVNLHNIVLIEDRSDATQSIAIITTPDGGEIELTGEDADVLFERAELFANATEQGLKALLSAGNQPSNPTL